MNVSYFPFVILIMLWSCTAPISNSKNQKLSDWDIVESFVSENWNHEKLLQIKGSPLKKSVDDNKKIETWVYETPESHLRQWFFSFDQHGNAVAIGFSPYDKSKTDFSDSLIKERWKKFGCKEVYERKVHSHFITDTKTLQCEQNRKVIYDHYGPVFISISKI